MSIKVHIVLVEYRVLNRSTTGGECNDSTTNRNDFRGEIGQTSQKLHRYDRATF